MPETDNHDRPQGDAAPAPSARPTARADGTSGRKVLLVTALLMLGAMLGAYVVSRHVLHLGNPDAAERVRLKRVLRQQADSRPTLTVSPPPAHPPPDEGSTPGR